MRRILTAIMFTTTLCYSQAQAAETLWKLNDEGKAMLCSYIPPNEEHKTAMVGRDVYWSSLCNQYFIMEGKRTIFNSEQYSDSDSTVIQYEAVMKALIYDAKKDKKKERPSQRIIPRDLEQKVEDLPPEGELISATPVIKETADSLTKAYTDRYQVNCYYNYGGMQIIIKHAEKVVDIDNRGGTINLEVK